MRRHITASAAAVALALGLANVAQADEDSGFYAGVGVGQFSLDLEDEDVGELDLGDDTALKLFGGWRFNPTFALELAYLDFGAPTEEFDGTEVSTEVTGFAPYVVTTAQFGMVELFAKVGFLFYDFTFEIEDIGEAEESDEDLVYGLGIGVVLGQAALRLEYEKVDVEDTDATAIWATGAWRF